MKTKFQKLLVSVLGLIWFSQQTILAQSSGVNENALQTGISNAADNIKKWAKLGIGAVLAIALIWVIYEVATGGPKAKEHGIAWIIAIILYGVAVAVIG